MQIVCTKSWKKAWCAHDDFFWISDSAIEHFREILEECKFDNGLSTLKMLKKINAGIFFASMNKEEGRLLLDNTTNAENEFDGSGIENPISNLINDNYIDHVDTNKNKTFSDNDSSSCSGYEAVVEK